MPTAARSTVDGASESAPARPRLALLALGLGAFAVGCTEFVAVGILPQIAAAFAVSEGAVGQLVTLNALAVAVGAPTLGALFARRACRPVLVWSLVVFAAAHLLAAVAPSFPVLLLTRLITGAVFGLYLAVAFAAAARLVSEDRRPGALATVQGGITTATALGVPLGMLLADSIDGSSGWRLPFGAIAALSLVAALAVAAVVPRLEAHSDSSAGARLGVLLRRRVALGISMIIVFWSGSFAAFTYIVPLLEARTGLSGGTVVAVLLLVGLASVAGNVLGGIGANRALGTTLLVTATLTLVGVVALFVSSTVAVLAIVFVGLWQLAAWSFVPAAQAAIYALGEDEGEAAVSFSVAGFNVGIVIGAGLGGLALDAADLEAVGVLAAALAAIAVVLTLVVTRLRPGRAA